MMFLSLFRTPSSEYSDFFDSFPSIFRPYHPCSFSCFPIYFNLLAVIL